VVETRVASSEMKKYLCLELFGVLAAFLVLRISTGRTTLTGGSEALLFRDRDFWNRDGAGATGGYLMHP
jgi:hypothetical protein